VLVSPVPRAAIALGKIAGSSTVAMVTGLLFFALLPLAGVSVTPTSFLATAGAMVVLAMALAGMGYTLAWLLDSSAGYHGVMMLPFVRLLLLSGAFFARDGAHPVLQWRMTLNPRAYAVGALRHTLYGSGSPATAGLPSFAVCLAITVLFAASTFALGVLITLRRTARDAT